MELNQEDIREMAYYLRAYLETNEEALDHEEIEKLNRIIDLLLVNKIVLSQ
jgi:succinate dehydrogenase flavin-adding protein (antitoxin of CptAB toxin-antitoxin module)